MIFVTVGTHEQSFDRLLIEIDRYAKENCLSKESIVVQKGYSNYELKHVTAQTMFSIEEMSNFYEKADLILTHGGPGSMFPAWILGKPIIAIPRQAKFNEHVDNHQLEFCDFMESKGKLVAVKDISELSNTIDVVMKKVQIKGHESKTQLFLDRFESEVESILGGQR
ncbi:glycosyltransferase [Priestia megaterium]|uniref:glycosyltransferase n=1 Tax=Priestia megaterium TaxID=1404 RepID=UPI0030C97C6A